MLRSCSALSSTPLASGARCDVRGERLGPPSIAVAPTGLARTCTSACERSRKEHVSGAIRVLPRTGTSRPATIESPRSEALFREIGEGLSGVLGADLSTVCQRTERSTGRGSNCRVARLRPRRPAFGAAELDVDDLAAGAIAVLDVEPVVPGRPSDGEDVAKGGIGVCGALRHLPLVRQVWSRSCGASRMVRRAVRPLRSISDSTGRPQLRLAGHHT